MNELQVKSLELITQLLNEMGDELFISEYESFEQYIGPNIKDII